MPSEPEKWCVCFFVAAVVSLHHSQTKKSRFAVVFAIREKLKQPNCMCAKWERAERHISWVHNNALQRDQHKVKQKKKSSHAVIKSQNLSRVVCERARWRKKRDCRTGRRLSKWSVVLFGEREIVFFFQFVFSSSLDYYKIATKTKKSSNHNKPIQ